VARPLQYPQGMSHHYTFRPLAPLPNPWGPTPRYGHLWSVLRRAFPEALAVLLLPNQGHLLLPGGHTETARNRLLVTLRTRAPWTEWASIQPPRNTPGRARTLCALRQIALLPEKQGYCDNPLAWKWSSYLDLMGAVENPWIDTNRLQIHLGSHEKDFKKRLHDYVAAGQKEDLAYLIQNAPRRWPPPEQLPGATAPPLSPAKTRRFLRTPENQAVRFLSRPQPKTEPPHQRAGG
jgi:hypothetical protein